jgi:hypothetical protein
MKRATAGAINRPGRLAPRRIGSGQTGMTWL